MGLRETLGFGQRVVLTEDFEDVADLYLIEPCLRGKGNSEYSSRMNLIENARKIGATFVYNPGVSSRPGFDRRHDKFTFFGVAYGPRKNS